MSDFFDLPETEFDYPEMSFDEYIEKSRHFISKINHLYWSNWHHRIAEDDEMENQPCEQCEGICTIKKGEDEFDCYPDHEGGVCRIREFEGENFVAEISEVIETMEHDLLLNCKITPPKQIEAEKGKKLLVSYMYKHYPELLAKFEELPQYEELEREIASLDKQIAEGKPEMFVAKSGRKYRQVPDDMDIETWDAMTPVQRLEYKGLLRNAPVFEGKEIPAGAETIADYNDEIDKLQQFKECESEKFLDCYGITCPFYDPFISCRDRVKKGDVGRVFKSHYAFYRFIKDSNMDVLKLIFTEMLKRGPVFYRDHFELSNELTEKICAIAGYAPENYLTH